MAIPNILLREQKKLEISNAELTVLLNISMYWWEADKWPYPPNSHIAQNTGMSIRSVQRAVSGLEKKGLMKRVKTEDSVAYHTCSYFDLSGLIKRLTQLADRYAGIQIAQPTLQ